MSDGAIILLSAMFATLTLISLRSIVYIIKTTRHANKDFLDIDW